MASKVTSIDCVESAGMVPEVGLVESQESRSSLYNAVSLAKKASNNSIKVLGSLAPLEDCYSPQLFPGKNVAISEFLQLGKWLMDSGVDILLLETMNSIAETEAGLIALQNYNHQVWVGFVLRFFYNMVVFYYCLYGSLEF